MYRRYSTSQRRRHRHSSRKRRAIPPAHEITIGSLLARDRRRHSSGASAAATPSTLSSSTRCPSHSTSVSWRSRAESAPSSAASIASTHWSKRVAERDSDPARTTVRSRAERSTDGTISVKRWTLLSMRSTPSVIAQQAEAGEDQNDRQEGTPRGDRQTHHPPIPGPGDRTEPTAALIRHRWHHRSDIGRGNAFPPS